MCGINCLVKLNANQPVRDSEIEKMNLRVAHRGPNGHGIFIDRQVGLGHVRLAIIDLSTKGHQPMSYQHKGKTIYITFNGEIYNFNFLKKTLFEKGYVFNSGTDTEVILASYLEKGFDCVNDFNGMFSFIIYDPDKKILFGARDRFGKKPLKYYLDEKVFIASSEIKAILANEIIRQVDYKAINDFLTLQYVPTPLTGFENIKKLPAAHYFIFNLASYKFEIKRYYDLNYRIKYDCPEKAIIKEMEGQFDAAIKSRLVADVPLGAFLSGGVDSSAIVAFMSKYLSRVKTFSIIFNEKKFNESIYSDKVAELFNTEHTKFVVTANDLLDNFEKLATYYDEPFADISALPTLLLCELTQRSVTVALSGDGGDENFGGYDKYRIHLALEKYKSGIGLISKIGALSGFRQSRVINNIIDRSLSAKHYNLTRFFDESTKNDFLQADYLSDSRIFEKIVENKEFDFLDEIFYLDFNSYIPDDICVKIDIAGMVNRLEVRCPMLDYNFVETMARIPWKYKTNLFSGKIIFKKMLEKYLPKEILYRPKHGFSVPIERWFRNELSSFVSDTILQSNGLVLKIMKKDKVERLIFEHQHGQVDNAKKLWSLLVLNMWYKKYIIN